MVKKEIAHVDQDQKQANDGLVPRMWGGRRKVRLSITLPLPLRQYAFRAAECRGEAVSELISDLLRRDMDKNEGEKGE